MEKKLILCSIILLSTQSSLSLCPCCTAASIAQSELSCSPWSPAFPDSSPSLSTPRPPLWTCALGRWLWSWFGSISMRTYSLGTGNSFRLGFIHWESAWTARRTLWRKWLWCDRNCLRCFQGWFWCAWCCWWLRLLWFDSKSLDFPSTNSLFSLKYHNIHDKLNNNSDCSVGQQHHRISCFLSYVFRFHSKAIGPAKTRINSSSLP